MNLIVVGNGPSALKANVGACVDACERVVRINNYETVGYEKAVGSKTDVWWRCGSRIRRRKVVPPTIVLYLPVRPDNLARKSARLQKGWGSWCVPVMHPEVLEAKKAMRIPGGKWPSSGAMAVWWFLRRIPVHHVIGVLGFDHFHDKGHYWNRNDCGKGRAHNGSAERAWFQQLKGEGRIEYLG